MRPASIREKSSSALTSFSSRRPLRCVISITRGHRVGVAASPRGPVRPREQFFERTQHQGQRGAEFVADVGEERGLGAIEFRERLGAPPLFLIGMGVADRRADLPGDQIEEAAIAVVEEAKRIEAGDQDARVRRLAAGQHGQHAAWLGARCHGPRRQRAPKRCPRSRT